MTAAGQTSTAWLASSSPSTISSQIPGSTSLPPIKSAFPSSELIEKCSESTAAQGPAATQLVLSYLIKNFAKKTPCRITKISLHALISFAASAKLFPAPFLEFRNGLSQAIGFRERPVLNFRLYTQYQVLLNKFHFFEFS